MYLNNLTKMSTEFEAKFLNVNVNSIINKIQNLGGKLLFKDRLMRRCVYNISGAKAGTWCKVRDEGDSKITMTFKSITKDSVDGVKEIELKVDSFKKARNFLRSIGLKERAYQENKRTRLIIEKDNVEFDIDHWPALEPYLEIEAKDEKTVAKYAKLLGFDMKDAMFGSTDLVYTKIFNISRDFINKNCPILTFDNILQELKR